MKLEDLKNTKIYLSNTSDRRAFQNKVFKLGVEWSGGYSGRCIMHLEYCFYYIDAHLKLTVDSSEDTLFFKRHTYEQIFLNDVLSIEKIEMKHEFKPFDKVLVKSTNDHVWKPAWYSYYKDTYTKCNYISTGGFAYEQCIPYEGNEHLAGTTNSPE